MSEILGQRILVLGASSGIGRATGLLLSAAGARVAFASRRRDRLDDAVASAEGDAIAIECDVREPDQCAAVAVETARVFGGIDSLVYAAGTVSLEPLQESDASMWRGMLDTNVIGAALITRAVLSYLQASDGRAVYVSSVAASERPPRPGMGVYMASKAALEACVAAWRTEHPEVGFTTLIIGDTRTGAGSTLTPEGIARYFPVWQERGYLYGRAMPAERVAEQIRSLLTADEDVPSTTLLPRKTLTSEESDAGGAPMPERRDVPPVRKP